jgi:hypothetical protein
MIDSQDADKDLDIEACSWAIDNEIPSRARVSQIAESPAGASPQTSAASMADARKRPSHA